MSTQSVSILEGNTFVVSDRRGDIEGGVGDQAGLFSRDTRFLSRWVLTVNGLRPNVLSVDDLQYFRVQFFMALSTGTIYVDSKLSVVRQRAVDNGFHEEITLHNHASEPIEVELSLSAAADFADLFEVKDKLEKKGEFRWRIEPDKLVFAYERGFFRRETWICSSMPAHIHEDGLSFMLRLPAHGSWTTCIDVTAVEPRAFVQPRVHTREGELRADLGLSVREWVESAPRLVSSEKALERTYTRSLTDLAALRFRTRFLAGAMPAAGLPWFMAIFGRDSLLTSYQTLPFAPELAATTLRTLALAQARIDDPFRDAEPGKILHELRLGELTAFEERPHSPYYGAADSTPLFLVLLDEYERWTGDRELVRALEGEARAAVRWCDESGDRDGDGYIEYERRNELTGLDNQCWKDSWDSIAFADGAIAVTPRATCELQGYLYDAKIRTARLARAVWNDPSWAAKLEREALELKLRFNRDFWIPERRFFALALDGKKRKVDSLTSNIGHLLWSGIVAEDKAHDCARHLMGEQLFTGWGVRTMAKGEGRYNPIGYHVGTVWPHDNSIIAWGLRRYGYRAEAARLAEGILDAAVLFQHRLPEAFAGYERDLTRFPVEYPTACSPQAWSSGATLLLLRTLLGLNAEGEHLLVEPALPPSIERLELLDVPGRWGRADAFGRVHSANGGPRSLDLFASI
jgi:glycogen debranching enzyme